MTIRWRLSLAFGVVVLLAVLATAVLLSGFKAQLEASLGSSAIAFARNLMGTVERDLHARIEGLDALLQSAPTVAEALAASNAAFAELGTEGAIAAELERRDALWTQARSGDASVLIDAVSGSPVAELLRAHQRAFRDRYGYEVYGEIFLTNRYGGNVAATAVTTDYRQDDELWWQAAARDGVFVGTVEFDESAGILALEIAVRIEDSNGALAGVAKAVLAIEELRQLVRTFRATGEHQSTAVYLFDGDGNIFIEDGVDPKAPLSAPPVEQLRALEDFVFTRGEADLLLARAIPDGYRELEPLPWKAVVSIAAEEVMAPFSRLRTTLLLVGLGMLALALVISGVTAAGIAGSLERAAESADHLARGELGAWMEAEEGGEVGRLMTAVRTMTDNVRETVSRILSSSNRLTGLASHLVGVGRELAAKAGEQAQASQETSAAVEELATSVREIATSSREVALTLEEASAAVEEMAQVIQAVASQSRALSSGVEETTVTVRQMVSSIEAVAANALRAQDASREAVDEAETGAQAMRQTMEGMQEIERAMQNIVQVVRNLDQGSQRITQITGTIEQIAKQSHLLALNATVQAAHAGEHGRGFATVAEEVGRLAVRSAEAVQEIGTTLASVQEQIRRALEVSETGARSVGQGLDRAGQAGDVLRRVSSSVAELSAMMIAIRGATEEQVSATTDMAGTFDRMRALTSEIEHATREQAESSERISRSIESMHTMAVQVSAATSEQSEGTDQIARTIQEIATIATRNVTAAQQIADSSNSLHRMSTELRQAASFFRLGGTASFGVESGPEEEGEEGTAVVEVEAAR